MCRNIKTLFNYERPVTEEEIRQAALQFVRKISGMNKTSRENEAAFLAAVDTIAAACGTLLGELSTNAAPKNRATSGGSGASTQCGEVFSLAREHKTTASHRASSII